MISKDDNILTLVGTYVHISDLYDNVLQYSVERFSNNNCPVFSDAEVMTVYLYAIHEMQFTKVKQIHKYTRMHFLSWFPNLPKYSSFVKRLNRLGEAFRILSSIIIHDFKPLTCNNIISLVDSMPIITCSGKRKAKVARELVNKGYNSTKKIYFYGLKIHAFAYKQANKIPFPQEIQISKASDNDLNIFKQAWGKVSDKYIFGDKIYIDKDFFNNQWEKYNSTMITPVKYPKGMPNVLKQRDKAADDLFSKVVSKIRQPIEAFFNWMNEKTDIQRASKVRSSKGLLVHVFGKMAAAFISLIF